MAWLRRLFRPRAPRTIAEIMPLFMESRRARGLRKCSLVNYAVQVRWMTKRHGGELLTSLTTEVVLRIASEKGMDFASDVLCMLRWALRERYLPPGFEIKSLPLPPLTNEEQVICCLAPDEAHRFLRAIKKHDPEMLPIFIIALFAGVRPNECARLEWEAINCAEKRIRIAAHVSKIRRARIIEGVPEILWRQLKPLAMGMTGRIIPEDSEDHALWRWARARRSAGRRAKVKLGHDILRHSFATYYIALTGNPALAAKALGHHDLGILAAHYDGVATKAEALEFFEEPGPS